MRKIIIAIMALLCSSIIPVNAQFNSQIATAPAIVPFVGFYPSSDSTPFGSTALGLGALSGQAALASTAFKNTAVGYQAMGGALTVAAQENSAFGNGSLASLTSGANNNAFGWNSLNKLTSGNDNNCFGNACLALITTQGGNTAVGDGACQDFIGSDTCTGMGAGALQAITSGAGNTCVGSFCLHLTTTSGFQTCVGNLACEDGVGSTDNDTGFGYQALANATQGNHTAVGSQALGTVSTGVKDTAFGRRAGFALTTGGNNLEIGYLVGSTTLATGSRNILIGTDSNCDAAGSATLDTFYVCASTGGTYALTGSLVAGSLTLITGGTLSVTTIGSGTGDFLCAPIGGGLISQGATTCVASDRRVKNDLGVITPEMAVARVMALPDEHRFTYKAGYGASGDHTGWFAQDIQKVWAGVVYKSKATKLTPDGELVFDRGEIGPDTTTAVKWLIADHRKSQREIVQLKKRLALLERRKAPSLLEVR